MSTTEILYNSAALHSLKRNQLAKLCKRHRLKASGKNTDMIARLEHYAQELLPGSAFFDIPSDAPDIFDDRALMSDGGEMFADEGGEDEDVRQPECGNKSVEMQDVEEQKGEDHAVPYPLRQSEQWEMVQEQSREEEMGIRGGGGALGTLSSFASFGSSRSRPSSAGEFGADTRGLSSKSSSVSSSIKALASSLKRAGSTMKLKSNQVSRPVSPLPAEVQDTSADLIYNAVPATEFDGDTYPGNSLPAALSSSTIRLVTSEPDNSSAPPSPVYLPAASSTADLFSLHTSTPAKTLFPPLTPADFTPSNPNAKLYPSLNDSYLSSPNGFMPKSSPRRASPPKRPLPSLASKVGEAEPFRFGSPQHSISNAQFHSAAAAVLEEMNRRLGQPNVVKMSLLENTGKRQREDDFGSKGPRTILDRFDAAHRKEFSKMDSIANHYSARRGSTPRRNATPRKGALQGRAAKASSSTRKPIASHGAAPGVASVTGEEHEKEPKSKRARMSSVVEGAHTNGNAADVAEESPSKAKRQVQISDNVVIVKDTMLKKLDSRRRSRSSVGRQSIGKSNVVGTPKANAGSRSHFGFLKSSAKLVRSVWKATIGTQDSGKASGLAASSDQTEPIPSLKASSKSRSLLGKGSKHSFLGHKSKPATATATGSISSQFSIPVAAVVMPRVDIPTITRTSTSLRSKRPSSYLGPTQIRKSSTSMAPVAGSISASQGQNRPVLVPPSLGGKPSLMGAGDVSGSITNQHSIRSKRDLPVMTADNASMEPKEPKHNKARSSTLYAPTASSLAKTNSITRPAPTSNPPSARPFSKTSGIPVLSPAATQGGAPKSPLPMSFGAFSFSPAVAASSSSRPSQIPRKGVTSPTGPIPTPFKLPASMVPSVPISSPPPVSQRASILSPRNAPSTPPKTSAAPVVRIRSTRRPRISRSKVIAKLDAHRNTDSPRKKSTGGLALPKSRSSLSAGAHARRSLAVGAMRKDLELEMSLKKGAMRKNEITRRKSRVIPRPSMTVTKTAAGPSGSKKLSAIHG
ncbi:hypothetical protein BOTBODRAFT_63016 [Botryobasidium botryosum FD-172 SS1]|uniref:SAP domain-containing protein n=1 Tax=Botryobasidium botryosum (strain FD-172 SS1) TaxID=930990 RepID=A0A067N4Y9_BOTB1|nr:hypothetical protein BOTBODRAFT_63016 [Botryobasidium botryosum FD-172 SS1]